MYGGVFAGTFLIFFSLEDESEKYQRVCMKSGELIYSMRSGSRNLKGGGELMFMYLLCLEK